MKWCAAEALDVLGVMCASHKWLALRLDGSCSVKQRQALVDTFNDPQVRLLPPAGLAFATLLILWK
jgi:SNF2 family DNA or RNA helicase